MDFQERLAKAIERGQHLSEQEAQAREQQALSEEELRRLIRDAGFVPKQRDTLYRTYFLN